MLKKILAGVAVVTVLAVGGVAVAGAVSGPAKSARRGPGNLVALAIRTAASTIGVDVPTLRAAVKSGHTIAQVASEHHVAPSKVVAAIVSKVDAAIDAAAQAGKLDAKQAAKAKLRVPALADRLVNHTTSIMRGLRRGAHERFHHDATLGAAASAIGISYDALRQAMHSGQSIAAIARAHGVSPAKVANAMAAVAQRAYANAARTHKVDPHYGRLIPKIMQGIVNGTTKLHGPAHRGAQHAHAAA